MLSVDMIIYMYLLNLLQNFTYYILFFKIKIKIIKKKNVNNKLYQKHYIYKGMFVKFFFVNIIITFLTKINTVPIGFHGAWLVKNNTVMHSGSTLAINHTK